MKKKKKENPNGFIGRDYDWRKAKKRAWSKPTKTAKPNTYHSPYARNRAEIDDGISKPYAVCRETGQPAILMQPLVTGLSTHALDRIGELVPMSFAAYRDSEVKVLIEREWALEKGWRKTALQEARTAEMKEYNEFASRKIRNFVNHEQAAILRGLVAA